jgi:hypothetical protein
MSAPGLGCLPERVVADRQADDTEAHAQRPRVDNTADRLDVVEAAQCLRVRM